MKSWDLIPSGRGQLGVYARNTSVGHGRGKGQRKDTWKKRRGQMHPQFLAVSELWGNLLVRKFSSKNAKLKNILGKFRGNI